MPIKIYNTKQLPSGELKNQDEEIIDAPWSITIPDPSPFYGIGLLAIIVGGLALVLPFIGDLLLILFSIVYCIFSTC